MATVAAIAAVAIAATIRRSGAASLTDRAADQAEIFCSPGVQLGTLLRVRDVIIIGVPMINLAQIEVHPASFRRLGAAKPYNGVRTV